MGELKDTVNLLGKIIYEMQIARILFFSEVYSYLQGATTAVRPTTPYFFPFPWAMAFQAPATPFMEKLIVLHDFIMAFLAAIVFFVLSLLFFLITRFVDKHDGPVLRITQIQHNSLLEFV
jgi:heme/copper-type cytochrome/quinol oxidase subunit 2